MQQALHYTAVQSGLGFLPLTLSALLGAKLVNRVLSAFGIAGTLGSGMALGAAGFMLLTQLSPHGTFWGFLPGILIAGLGQAIVFTTMFIAAGTGIEPKDQGVSSAIVSTGQQIGSAIGLAIIMAIVTAATTADSALEAQTPEMLTHSIQLAFYTSAAFALIGVIVAFVMLRNKKTSAKQ
ncbi:MFS transporter [Bacillus sp. FJAT-26390]|uniref:MFS transporter n=1 Tax=Bacillus sp. FJAT-26390 TaxID=1743142 RepID=UPI0008080752|nr:MFS transporter [Bacillus sp. FJAT-26390]OBZ07678.1 hypothetical protein A7975_28515 [Bacillus sp. FJAT-26390]